MRDSLSRRPTWLGATSVHSRDPIMPSLASATVAMCNTYPHLRFVINLFDEANVNAARVVRAQTGSHPSIEGAHVHGMKTLFWKRILTPAFVRERRIEVLWLVDSDIAMHPSNFPLGTLAGILRATNATLLQPSIRALVHGTHHMFLRVRSAHMTCVATTAAFVELQTPIFAVEAWESFYSTILGKVSDADLGDSDYGIDIVWCAALKAAFPSRPTCLVTPGHPATHLNTHAIEKFMR